MYIIIHDRLIYLYKKSLSTKKWLHKTWYFSDTETMKPDRIQQRDSKSERAAINNLSRGSALLNK